MLSDTNTTPNADERKCKAKAIIKFNDSVTEDVVLENEIVSANLICEYQIAKSYKDINQPACAISVTFDNYDIGFDLTDTSNMYYSLTDKSVIELYFSTTEANKEDSFVKKGTVFFSTMTFSEKNAVINGYCPFGFSHFDGKYVVEAFGNSRKTAKEVTDYCLETYTPFGNICCCVVDEQISNRLYAYSDFTYSTWSPSGTTTNYLTMPVSLPYFAVLTGVDVRYFVNEDGNIRLKVISSDVSEEITKTDFIKKQVSSFVLHDGTVVPIMTFTDRGNILRQLADVVLLQDEKIYKLEIYRINYTFDKGMLSAENIGRIIAA